MTRKTRLVAAVAFAAGLAATGVALAQTQPESAAPRAAPARTASPPAQSPPPSNESEASPLKPWDPNSGQPTYSVDPPPDGPSGIYLPAVVGGYAKSVAGCVVIGCEDGPQVGGSPAPSSAPPSSGPSEPPPANPGSSDAP